MSLSKVNFNINDSNINIGKPSKKNLSSAKDYDILKHKSNSLTYDLSMNNP